MIIKTSFFLFILMSGFFAFGLSLDTHKLKLNQELSKNNIMEIEQELQEVLKKTNDLSQYRVQAAKLDWN